MSVELERSAWLSSDVLLLVGRFGAAPENGIEAAVVSNGDRVLAEAGSRYLERAEPEAGATPRQIVIARFPNGTHPAHEPAKIEIGSGEDMFLLGDRAAERSNDDWRGLLAEGLAECDEADRLAVLESIVKAAAPGLGRPGGFSLGLRLADLREELRPHLPQPELDFDQPQAMKVEGLLAIDEVSFVISGWIHDSDHDTVRLTAVSPESQRAELLERAFRYVRGDIRDGLRPPLEVSLDKHGFISFFELEAPSLLPDGWLAELATSGNAIEAPAPQVVRDVDHVRNWIVSLLAREPVGSRELMEDHVHPAFSRLQDRVAATAKIDTVVELGKPTPNPTTSIVVPIYKRTDFLEYQLALLGQDPELHETDLIFVLDSPEVAEAVDREARELQSLHGLPFRLAIMNRNAGFALVNNAGVSLARSRLLLLMNSDVLPDRPGWLGKMIEFHDATPDIGALGPKLLYEDDSLQHAGMYFDWDPILDVWQNQHYFKGLDRHLPAANVGRPVPAVTGACMMVARELYERRGGFPHRYVRGGFEDSDLCLQFLEEGRENWYMPGAELYHLEAQSYLLTEERMRISIYNAWLQTRLWGDSIAALTPERT